MKSALAVIGITSLATLVGCINEREYMDPNANNNVFGGDAYYDEGNVNIQQASVRGDIGPIRQFDDRQATGYGYDDPEFGSSQITLNATANGGTGLVMLYLDKSIQDLPLGRTVMQGSNDDFSNNYVQLCSDQNDVLLTTSRGQCIRFQVGDVRVFKGRDSMGVRGINLSPGDSVIALSILRHVDAKPEERAAYLRMRRAIAGETEAEEVPNASKGHEAPSAASISDCVALILHHAT